MRDVTSNDAECTESKAPSISAVSAENYDSYDLCDVIPSALAAIRQQFGDDRDDTGLT